MVGRVRLQVSSLPSPTLHTAPLSLSSIPISRVVFAIHNRRPRFRQFRDVAADPDNPSSRVLTDADLLFYSPRFILFILRPALILTVFISSRSCFCAYYLAVVCHAILIYSVNFYWVFHLAV